MMTLTLLPLLCHPCGTPGVEPMDMRWAWRTTDDRAWNRRVNFNLYPAAMRGPGKLARCRERFLYDLDGDYDVDLRDFAMMGMANDV